MLFYFCNDSLNISLQIFDVRSNHQPSLKNYYCMKATRAVISQDFITLFLFIIYQHLYCVVRFSFSA
jgi:hypothetical protein